MKPKLYQYAACPFCNKVKSALEYKGVDYETVEVHPLNKKEIAFSEGYRKVPIYIDSQGVQVNDSNAIMRHLDQEFPERKVFRADPQEAKREEEWLAWSEGLVQGLPTAVYETFPEALKAFDYITKVGKFSWFQKRMIKYSGAFVMSLVAKKIAKRQQIENPERFLKEKAGQWVQGLNKRPFMGGEEPNAADLAVFGIVRTVAGLHAASILEENAEFKAWFQRVQQKSVLVNG